MLLENKNAVIYGAGGAVGSAIARAFAREGAKVFLAGRTLAKLDTVAAEISAANGVSETAQVDALDAEAVELYINAIAEKSGHLDISFNAIGLEDVQGKSFADLSFDDFNRPIANAMRTHFITSMAVRRPMIRQGSGVIMAITANAGSMAFSNVGGFGVACAAIEGFCRQLAAELGPQGVRVICLRSAGSPDTPGVKEVFELHARNSSTTFEEFLSSMSSGTLLKRLPLLAEVANAAALMASDHASAMTAAVANLTCGMIAD